MNLTYILVSLLWDHSMLLQCTLIGGGRGKVGGSGRPGPLCPVLSRRAHSKSFVCRKLALTLPSEVLLPPDRASCIVQVCLLLWAVEITSVSLTPLLLMKMATGKRKAAWLHIQMSPRWFFAGVMLKTLPCFPPSVYLDYGKATC